MPTLDAAAMINALYRTRAELNRPGYRYPPARIIVGPVAWVRLIKACPGPMAETYSTLDTLFGLPVIRDVRRHPDYFVVEDAAGHRVPVAEFVVTGEG